MTGLIGQKEDGNGSARYVILPVIILGVFGDIVTGEAEKHNVPIVQSNLSMDINSAVEDIKGKDVKRAAEHMASIAAELKRAGGALDDKTLSDIEKLAAVGLNSEEEFRQAVVTICMSSGDKVKGCMLDVLRKQAFVAIIRQRAVGENDGPMGNQLRKAFTTVARRNDGTLLLAELDLMSRYRIELASILAEDQIALSKVDTDVLYGIEREAIMRKTWENIRFACLGLRELAARNADGVSTLIVEAEKSEVFNVPKGGGERVYVLKGAAKNARVWLDMHASKRPKEFVRDRLSAMMANKDAWDESIANELIWIADRTKQSTAIPQLREIVAKKLMPAESNWIETVIGNIEKEPK